jgi:hypothetical protein
MPSPDWAEIELRLAEIVYSKATLTERHSAITGILKAAGYYHYDVRLELESMGRAAAEGREAPFRLVAKDLLAYCNQQLRRPLGQYVSDEHDEYEENDCDGEQDQYDDESCPEQMEVDQRR